MTRTPLLGALLCMALAPAAYAGHHEGKAKGYEKSAEKAQKKMDRAQQKMDEAQQKADEARDEAAEKAEDARDEAEAKRDAMRDEAEARRDAADCAHAGTEPTSSERTPPTVAGARAIIASPTRARPQVPMITARLARARVRGRCSRTHIRWQAKAGWRGPTTR